MGKYYIAISQLLQHEDKVRNQRTNWFLIIQGFLIAAITDVIVVDKVPLSKTCIIEVLLGIGVAVSCAFYFAAWRSEKAYTMGLKCWDNYLRTHLRNIMDYPPVCLLTRNILDFNRNTDIANDIGQWDWNNMLHNQLLYDCQTSVHTPKRILINKRKPSNSFKVKRDLFLNRWDILLPYLFVPLLFLFVEVTLMVLLILY